MGAGDGLGEKQRSHGEDTITSHEGRGERGLRSSSGRGRPRGSGRGQDSESGFGEEATLNSRFRRMEGEGPHPLAGTMEKGGGISRHPSRRAHLELHWANLRPTQQGEERLPVHPEPPTPHPSPGLAQLWGLHVPPPTLLWSNKFHRSRQGPGGTG